MTAHHPRNRPVGLVAGAIVGSAVVAVAGARRGFTRADRR